MQTRIFGEVDIEEEKVLNFPNGIIGFPELTRFALIHDAEKEDKGGIRWLQSLQEPEFALPVTDPLYLIDSYNPEVEDELLQPIGNVEKCDLLVLVAVSVPSDPAQISINLMAPVVINVTERKGCQVLVEGGYPIKFPVYDILQARKTEMLKGGN